MNNQNPFGSSFGCLRPRYSQNSSSTHATVPPSPFFSAEVLLFQVDSSAHLEDHCFLRSKPGSSARNDSDQTNALKKLKREKHKLITPCCYLLCTIFSDQQVAVRATSSPIRDREKNKKQIDLESKVWDTSMLYTSKYPHFEREQATQESYPCWNRRGCVNRPTPRLARYDPNEVDDFLEDVATCVQL